MSRRLQYFTASSELELINAATAAFPPTTFGVVSPAWQNADAGVVSEFDLELSAAGAASVTVVKLYGAIPFAGTIADTTFTATAATDVCADATHGLLTGDGPVQLTSSGTLPAGLALLTDYYIIRVDANSYKLATSLNNALAGTAVDITDTGTGTHTLADVASTKLIRWVKRGDVEATLTLASDREGFSIRCAHSSCVVAYGMVWTGTAANAIRAVIIPVEER